MNICTDKAVLYKVLNYYTYLFLDIHVHQLNLTFITFFYLYIKKITNIVIYGII